MRRDELQKLIQGAICTLPAPFDDNFRADYGRMYDLCKSLVEQGLRTGNSLLKVAAAGGEGMLMADDEWAAMVQCVVSAADGQVPDLIAAVRQRVPEVRSRVFSERR